MIGRAAASLTGGAAAPRAGGQGRAGPGRGRRSGAAGGGEPARCCRPLGTRRPTGKTLLVKGTVKSAVPRQREPAHPHGRLPQPGSGNGAGRRWEKPAPRTSPADRRKAGGQAGQRGGGQRHRPQAPGTAAGHRGQERALTARPQLREPDPARCSPLGAAERAEQTPRDRRATPVATLRADPRYSPPGPVLSLGS